MENNQTLGEFNGVKFGVEPMEFILEELKVLHKMQWDELTMGDQGLELLPDYDKLLAGNLDGKYIVFTARKGGDLIGNCGVWLYESSHTRDLMAKEDTLFLHPAHRKGLVGVRFFKYCEEVLRQLGVVEVTFTVSPKNNVWKVWQRLGYELKMYQMAKVL